jgi:Coenzyme PQQ synthesis protein D (PqqD)
MWCGCRPMTQFGDAAPQPFSTQDGDKEAEARSASVNDVRGEADWSKMMRWVPVPHPKIQGVAVGGETVLLDLRTGRSYRLNVVGTAIWEQCTGSATLQEIHRGVSVRLEMSVEQVHEGVVSFIAQWSHDGLLIQAESPRG